MDKRRFIQYKENGSVLWTPLVGVAGLAVAVPAGLIGGWGRDHHPNWVDGQRLCSDRVGARIWRGLRELSPSSGHSTGTGRRDGATAATAADGVAPAEWFVHPLFAPLVAVIGLSAFVAATAGGSAATAVVVVFIVVGVEAALWFFGPAARFVVTPGYLWIDSTYHSRRVPRQLIRSMRSDGTGIRVSLRRTSTSGSGLIHR
jgi:hypothetical protein